MSRLEPRTVDLKVEGGAHIQYLECGAGSPVVFFHGAGGAEPTAAFLPALAERYRVLAPSRCGYDGSTGPTSTAADDGQVMGAFLRQMVDGPVALIAESAGGASACWLAALYPDLVSRLILVAPMAFAPAEHRPAGGPPPQPDAIELRLFGSHPAWTTPPTDEDRLRRQRNVAANRDRIRPPDGNRDLLERLPDIQAPTLILWGTRDEMGPSELGHVYQRLIPNSYRLYIYGAAHALPIAACQQFVKLATDFIERGEAFIVNQPAS